MFGWPAYAKFMAWPCYVYLQLKMSGYKGTITVHGSRKVALECEEGDAAYAELACAMEELKFYKDNIDPADMTSLKKPTTEHDPVLKFKSADDTKLVDFVPGDSSKQFSMSANLIRNRKARSSSSSVRTGTSLHGDLLTCRVYRGDSLSTPSILIQSISRSGSSFGGSMWRGGKLLVKRWTGSWPPGLLLKSFTQSG